ncbi:YdeI/OmpD-associated family protein [Actinotalea sp. M2MS4P-6]|uniref:YdeI/OmpD-associated family protein n=1 Tax=Actinotalea sp. M2MS4P-6 TaxID=2983762 RepID=UPI0021E4034F|nr:YdeI/OmpD-associated family protein [Actinotalea sp. M2MS4P-6]MCV2392715.1 YdeI/OmpD-associated family protein [Actinotalea sp. M2MS4P-6]
MEFGSVVEATGGSTTGIPVPDQVVRELGKRAAVVVAVGGHEFRTTFGTRGGRALIPLSAAHRTAAGVAAGDEVLVHLTADTAPRTVEVPEDLAAAIAASPTASDAWQRLAPSHRKEHVRAVEAAKKPETRSRRIAAAITKLESSP